MLMPLQRPGELVSGRQAAVVTPCAYDKHHEHRIGDTADNEPIGCRPQFRFVRANAVSSDCHELAGRNPHWPEPVGESRDAGFDEWRVAKSFLVGSLSAAMSNGKLLAAEGLPDGAELRRQLEDYQVEVTASGHVTANAVAGSHDEMVIATVLAWFAAENVGPPHEPVTNVAW